MQPIEAIVRLLEERTAGVEGRPRVVAVDGGSGAGKTTFAARLAAAMPGSVVVHTDSLSWEYSFFGWSELLVELLAAVRTGEAVAYRPPAWDEHDVPGAIEVPAGARTVIVEGVGAARREAAEYIDAIVWVECDRAVAERRGIERDGGDEEAVAFWQRWMAEETPFLEADRPWERADVIVDGGYQTSPSRQSHVSSPERSSGTSTEST